MGFPAGQLAGARRLLAFSWLAASCTAATYYVASNGRNSADGTINAPWGTLQYAVDYPGLTGGDTIYVRGGTYAQRVTITQSGSDAAHPLTFAAYPGETPILDGTTLTPLDDNNGLITIEDAAFLHVVGFELANYRVTKESDSPNKVPCGIYLHGASSDIEIRGNTIHDIANHFAAGNAFGLAAYGDTLHPITGLVIADNEIHHCRVGNSESLSINGNIDGFVVSGNRVHDNTNIGIVAIGYEETYAGDPSLNRARGGQIRGNTVWECTSSANPAYENSPCAGGIYVDGGTDIVIENNTSYRNDIGLELASEHEGRTTDHITVRNNLIWGNRVGGILLGGAEPANGGSEYNAVFANTLWANDTRADGNGEIQFNHWCHHNTIRHNLIIASAQALLCTNPVAATVNKQPTNTDNQFDWNLWWAPGGATASEWQWKNSARTGFTAWKSATSQDAHSLFTDPQLRSLATAAGALPDLHLRPASPAIDAGDPAFILDPDERDCDRQSRLTGTRLDLGADELAPRDAWRRAYFGPTESATSALSADADGDGLPNLLEYAFGGDPLHPASCPHPVAGSAANDNSLQLTLAFLQPPAATDLTYLVQFSTDLVNWADGSRYSPFGDVPATPFTHEFGRLPVPDGTRITVGTALAPGAPRVFLRLLAIPEAVGP
ncbi:MAG: right-handed parallel beta-helix repeat-containing protein [Opitutaceae bacterium]|nr:right-handed parallel beta-helix repeat-containing protein [Opitutaceae bacterium]